MNMIERQPEVQESSFGLKDVLYALFKHKRKIVLCAIGGLLAAIGCIVLYPPVYESQAKLLVRYVLERSAVDQSENTVQMNQSGRSTDSVMNSEVEILTSWDLAVQVAKAIGPKRILPGAGAAASENAAAAAVSSGLTVTEGGEVLFLSYKNRDPELATLVLNELVNRYFVKHLEVHRSAGAFDFVTQQTDQVRARLDQTEDALKGLKTKYGVTTLAETTKALNSELAQAQEKYRDAEADVAEQRARVKEMGSSTGNSSDEGRGRKKASTSSKSKKGKESSAETAQPSEDDLDRYKALVAHIDELHKAEVDLSGKYTARNPLLQSTRSQISDAQERKHDLEKKYPDIAAKSRMTNADGSESLSQSAMLAGLEAKTGALKTRVHDVQEQIRKLSEVAPQIADLERRKEMEENNYKYFEASLEKARIDEALDPSKMPNISAVQQPSPPALVTKKRNKIALVLAGGGVALGFAFALLRELILNQTVKRPLELEERIGVAPMISIPYQSRKALARAKNNDYKELALPKTNGTHTHEAPWEEGHFIRSFSEAMRDRISMYFERHGLTHKPKLLGVTSFSAKAGTSTIAAGLAAALSEMRDGKVLLVDVNVGNAAAHPFLKGRPAATLGDLIQPGSPATPSGAENLYLATVGSNEGPVQRALKRFFAMMPNLKASDFDYIVFDMPPLNQTTPTLGMSEYMDKILLIVEAEKTHRDVVKRGYKELKAGRADVSIVMNKVRSYVPESLGDHV